MSELIQEHQNFIPLFSFFLACWGLKSEILLGLLHDPWADNSSQADSTEAWEARTALQGQYHSCNASHALKYNFCLYLYNAFHEINCFSIIVGNFECW